MRLLRALFAMLDRLAGRFVCHQAGCHTADWTWAHMTGGEPVCRFCKRPRSEWRRPEPLDVDFWPPERRR